MADTNANSHAALCTLLALAFAMLSIMLEGCQLQLQATSRGGYSVLPTIATHRLGCTKSGFDCGAERCCQEEGYACYKKNDAWAACLPKDQCIAGCLWREDKNQYRTPWNCTSLDRNDITPSRRTSPPLVCPPGQTPPRELIVDSAEVEEAVAANNTTALELLLGGQTAALHKAAAMDEALGTKAVEALKLMFPPLAEISAEWPDERNGELLLEAAVHNNTEGVKLLLEYKAPVDAVNNKYGNGETPLHYAVLGCPDAIPFLLEARASPNVGDKYGMTPAAWVSKGFPFDRNSTFIMQQLLNNHGDEGIYFVRDTESRKTAHDIARLGHDKELTQYLDDNQPHFYRVLFYVVKQKEFWLWAALGLGLGLSLAALSVCTHCTPGRKRGQNLVEGIPLGAWLLAAETNLNQSSLSWKGPYLRKASFLPEVLMNVWLVFGQFAYTVNVTVGHDQTDLSGHVVLLLWFVLWWLPAAAAFGMHEVYENPALTVTAGRGPWMRAGILLHFVRFLVVYMVCFVHLKPKEEWERTLSHKFPQEGTLAPPWGICPRAALHGINTEEWFLYYFHGILLASVLCPFLLLFRSFARRLQHDEVEVLATRIWQAGSAKGIRSSCPKISPVSIFWVRFDIVCMALDVGGDLSVMLNLLCRQHYRLLAISLAIFVGSLLPELFLNTPAHLARELSSRGASVTLGYRSDRLLSTLRRERGFEGFFQLALAAYSMIYLSDEPFTFLTTLGSMAMSTYSLAGHLYTSMDLRNPESTNEEESSDSVGTDSSSDSAEEEVLEKFGQGQEQPTALSLRAHAVSTLAWRN